MTVPWKENNQRVMELLDQGRQARDAGQLAEAAALRLGFKVLVATTDKPHGLREAYLVDADGYVWVPDAHVKM